MDGKDAAHSPISAPIYRPSAQITSDEYEYYMRKAQQMRAESAAELFRSLARGVRRLFARAKPARHRNDPVFAKSRAA